VADVQGPPTTDQLVEIQGLGIIGSTGFLGPAGIEITGTRIGLTLRIGIGIQIATCWDLADLGPGIERLPIWAGHRMELLPVAMPFRKATTSPGTGCIRILCLPQQVRTVHLVGQAQSPDYPHCDISIAQNVKRLSSLVNFETIFIAAYFCAPY